MRDAAKHSAMHKTTSTTGIIWPKMSFVRRLRNPNLNPGGCRETENETSDAVEIMKVDLMGLDELPGDI